MTERELYEQLQTTGLQVAYRAFDESDVPEMPFLVYFFDRSNNFAADGLVHQKIDHYQVQLFTKEKDPDTEALVEAALGFTFWQKEEFEEDDEACTRIVYEVEV